MSHKSKRICLKNFENGNEWKSWAVSVVLVLCCCTLYIEMEFIEINAKKLTWSRRETCIPIEMPSRLICIVTCNIKFAIFFIYFFTFFHSYWQGLFFVPCYVLFPIPYSVCDIEYALFTNKSTFHLRITTNWCSNSWQNLFASHFIPTLVLAFIRNVGSRHIQSVIRFLHLVSVTPSIYIRNKNSKISNL